MEQHKSCEIILFQNSFAYQIQFLLKTKEKPETKKSFLNVHNILNDSSHLFCLYY